MDAITVVAARRIFAGTQRVPRRAGPTGRAGEVTLELETRRRADDERWSR